MRKISRGDIYLCDFGELEGSIQHGVRPVIVMQDTLFNQHSSTTIVAPISTSLKKNYLPSHVYLGKRFGLFRCSTILLEQIRTINKSDLKEYVGTVTDERILEQLWRSVKITMGFWDFRIGKANNAFSLCPDCLEKKKKSGLYNIARVDYFARKKEMCEVCGKEYGFNYYLIDKEENRW